MFNGNTSSKGPFSIAMLDYRSVAMVVSLCFGMCYAEAMIQISKKTKRGGGPSKIPMLQNQVKSRVKSEAIFADISEVSRAFLSKSLEEHWLGYLLPKSIYLTMWSKLVLAQAKVCGIESSVLSPHATYTMERGVHHGHWTIFKGDSYREQFYQQKRESTQWEGVNSDVNFTGDLRDQRMDVMSTPILCVIASGLGLSRKKIRI